MELLIFKLGIVLLVGFIGGKIATRFGLPNVSGYLLAGLLLGPSFSLFIDNYAGYITAADQENLKFIGEIALAFIAFSIGSEFNVKTLKKTGKSILTIANYEVLFAFATVFLLLLFIPKPEPIMVGGYNPFSAGNIALGLILASMSCATAPAATLMVMRQYKAYGPLTKTVLPVTAVDDIHGIVIFGIFISVAQMLVNPTGANIVMMIATPLIEIAGSLLIGAITGFILSYFLNRIKKNKEDFQVISVLTVVFTMGVVLLFNHSFKDNHIALSVLLSNMMAGFMVSNLAKKSHDAFEAVNNFTTPFYLLFFTLAGASLNLSVLKTEWIVAILAIVYIIARGTGKYTGAFIGAKVAKKEPQVVKYLGFALLPQGGVSLGLLVVVSAQLNVYYPLISTIIMLSILVYETGGPVFAKFAISKAGEINGLDALNNTIEGEI